MLLSVVIPFYREIDLIGRAVGSVLDNAGAVDAVQVLVCNDGNIPEQTILDRLDARGRVVTRVARNTGAKGPGGARNTGLDLAEGEAIAFLDADDHWRPGKVAAQIAALQQGASFVATAYAFEGSPVVIQPPATLDQPIDVFLKRGIGTSTVMISRSLLQQHRFRDFRFAQDIDFWYALARSPEFRYRALGECFVEYSTGGSTKNKWVQLQYLNKVITSNRIPPIAHGRILASYVLAGVYNHYIKGRLGGPKR